MAKYFSPYSFRTLKKTKVNGIKIQLRSYGTKPYTEIDGIEYPRRDIYFEIRSNQGLYIKETDPDSAIEKYNRAIEFEKQQLSITF